MFGIRTTLYRKLNRLSLYFKLIYLNCCQHVNSVDKNFGGDYLQGVFFLLFFPFFLAFCEVMILYCKQEHRTLLTI